MLPSLTDFIQLSTRFTAPLGDKWLLDRKLSTKTGILCEIRDSFPRGSDKGWLSGDHEGETVLVLSVFDSGNDRYSSRARIKFYDSEGPNPAPEIPAQLLQPVHPDKTGQTVIILSGEWKGEEGKVQQLASDGCVVSLAGKSLIVEAKLDGLVRVEHGDV